jgi:hypothetical protein
MSPTHTGTRYIRQETSNIVSKLLQETKIYEYNYGLLVSTHHRKQKPSNHKTLILD